MRNARRSGYIARSAITLGLAASMLAPMSASVAIEALAQPDADGTRHEGGQVAVSGDEADNEVSADVIEEDFEALAGTRAKDASGGEHDGGAAGEDGDTAAGEDGTAAGDDGTASPDGSDATQPADAVTLSRAALSPGSGYDAKEYLDAYQIPIAKFESSQPARPGYPLSNATDGNWNNTYMVNNSSLQEAEFTISFDKAEQVSKILYRHFHNVQQAGFPTHFKLLVSQTGEEGSYEEVADYKIEDGQRPSGAVCFTLSQPVTAKYVKFKILASPGGIVVSEMKFLRHDSVADEVDHLFANEEKTVLAEAYNSAEALARLRAEVEAHPSAESLLGYLEVAEMVLAGTWGPGASFDRATISEADKGFDSQAYLGEYQAKVKSVFTDNPGTSGNGIDNAFDGDWSTRYYATSTGSSTITMELERETDVHRLIYANGYQNGYGYPTTMTVAFSLTGREGSWREVPCNFGASNSKLIFTLSRAVRAKYVRITMSGIYGGTNFRPCAAELRVMRFDQVAQDVANLFEDERTQFALKGEWNSVEALSDLQSRVDAHPGGEEFARDMARAWAVFRGEVKDQNERLDWPVHVIQKTGDDSERAVWVFLAEGYRADEMDKFVADITERAQDMLEMEPFRSMAPYINMYAYCAESNESGYSSPGDERDTFFKSYWSKQTVNGGSNQGRCNLARTWIEQNYLDAGGKIMHATAIVNTDDYFGQGNGTSTASLSAGYKMTVHEGSHMFASLVDHYTYANWQRADNAGTNQTSNSDPNTIRWKEFLGHRGTTITGNGYYNPTTNCLMDNYDVDKFCEVCRESIFRKINDKLPEGKKNPLYVAQPELTLVRTDEEVARGTGTGNAAVDKAGTAKSWDAGPVINESNITSANGRKLKYRTVVSNYLEEDQEVELTLKITGADGRVKHNWSLKKAVHPNTVSSVQGLYPNLTSSPVRSYDDRQAGAVSVELVTEELSGLEAGDKIEARVTYNGELMGTDATISFGTARISYKLKDAEGNVVGDMPEMGTVEQRVLAGTNNLTDPPKVYGYAYVGSSVDEESWRAEEGQTTEIVRYYREASVTVTRRLVDPEGGLVEERRQRVASGETLTPAAADFEAGDGYEVVAPEPVVVGNEDVVLTYTYARRERPSGVSNIAQGKPAQARWAKDGSSAENGKRPASITVDGDKSASSYAQFGSAGKDEASYLQVDLGGLYELKAEDGSYENVVRLWRYWQDSRTYAGTVIVASELGTFEEGDREVIYNSDAANFLGFGEGTDPTYVESASGHGISVAKSVKARAIRVYGHGSDKNKDNHVVELEVYGEPVEDERAARLAQAIAERSKMLESGLYTELSSSALASVLQDARALVYQGLIDQAELEGMLARLDAATAKLRLRDEVAHAQIDFLGGSLRYEGADERQVDGLRLGFAFALPEGAEVVWEKTGWYVGTEGSVGSELVAAEHHAEGEAANSYVANLVISDLSPERYGTSLTARAQVCYSYLGFEYITTMDEAVSRSVDDVAGRIELSATAPEWERALAEKILAV